MFKAFLVDPKYGSHSTLLLGVCFQNKNIKQGNYVKHHGLQKILFGDKQAWLSWKKPTFENKAIGI